MACKKARKTVSVKNEVTQKSNIQAEEAKHTSRLLFGVDTKTQTNDLLQNNIEEFEWIVRNKVYPNFCGRYLTGENCLTKKEIQFLHRKGCKIAAIYSDTGAKKTKEQGQLLAKKIDLVALELGIPEGTAIFLEIDDNETATRNFMRGFAEMLMLEGFVPGFKANTDAKFNFDREFSRGMQSDKDVFKKCLIWAVAPSLAEYERTTTTHLVHPDNWMPFAPSGITRNDVAIWQYGRNCHPIFDDTGEETTFNVDLVRDNRIIVEKMF